MVCGEQHCVAVGDCLVHHVLHQFVDGFHRLGDGRVNTGVTHHVAVGEVQDDHILFFAPDLGDELFRHFGGAHLRQQVIGGHLGAVHQDAFLVFEHGLTAAVEEEGDVGVFFSFRDAELVLPGLGDGLSQRILHQLFVEEDVHAGKGSVVGGEAAVIEGNGVHPFLRHILLRKGRCELARPVVAEIVEDDGVALFDGGDGLPAFGDHDGFDELIRDIGVITCLNAFLGRCKRGTLALHQEVIGFLYAVPAFVTVHRVEAAADGGHLAGGQRHLLFQFLHETQTAARIRVAAIHEGVDIDLFQAFILGHPQELIHVVQAAVHAAVGGEAHQVEFLAALFHIVVGGLDLRILQKFVLPAGDVDLHQVLIHYASGAQVHVTYLGITHLAVRQADIFPAGLQMAEGILFPQGVDVGRSLGPYGIGVVVEAFSPTVQNHQ